MANRYELDAMRRAVLADVTKIFGATPVRSRTQLSEIRKLENDSLALMIACEHLREKTIFSREPDRDTAHEALCLTCGYNPKCTQMGMHPAFRSDPVFKEWREFVILRAALAIPYGVPGDLQFSGR